MRNQFCVFFPPPSQAACKFGRAGRPACLVEGETLRMQFPIRYNYDCYYRLLKWTCTPLQVFLLVMRSFTSLFLPVLFMIRVFMFPLFLFVVLNIQSAYLWVSPLLLSAEENQHGDYGLIVQYHFFPSPVLPRDISRAVSHVLLLRQERHYLLVCGLGMHFS